MWLHKWWKSKVQVRHSRCWSSMEWQRARVRKRRPSSCGSLQYTSACQQLGLRDNFNPSYLKWNIWLSQTSLCEDFLQSNWRILLEKWKFHFKRDQTNKFRWWNYLDFSRVLLDHFPRGRPWRTGRSWAPNRRSWKFERINLEKQRGWLTKGWSRQRGNRRWSFLWNCLRI